MTLATVAGVILAVLAGTPAQKNEASPGPTVVVDPPCIDVLSGSGTFTVDINIEGVTDLGGFEFTLGYDQTVINAEDVNVELFLASDPASNVQDLSGSPNNVAGTHYIAAGDLALTGPDGSDTLARASMHPVAAGTSPLAISGVQLGDTSALPIVPDSVTNGEVRVDSLCPGTDTPTPTNTPTTPTPTNTPVSEWPCLFEDPTIRTYLGVDLGARRYQFMNVSFDTGVRTPMLLLTFFGRTILMDSARDSVWFIVTGMGECPAGPGRFRAMVLSLPPAFGVEMHALVDPGP